MEVLGMAETAEDIDLWAINKVQSCVDLRLIDDTRKRWVQATIDSEREPSLKVWDLAMDTYLPRWMFGPPCYDAGELLSHQGATQTFTKVRDLRVIPRAGDIDALLAIPELEKKEIALDCCARTGGWNYWLLDGASVWLIGGETPRAQWLTWLELRHRRVHLAGVVLNPPSWYSEYRLDPSNLSPLVDDPNLGRCSAVNARCLAAFWGVMSPTLGGRLGRGMPR